MKWRSRLNGLQTATGTLVFGPGSEFGFEKPLQIFGLLGVVPKLPCTRFGIRSVSVTMYAGPGKSCYLSSAYWLGSALSLLLIIGSTIFGIGWGLSGFCPGPAFVSLIYGYKTTFIFCIAMIAGMSGTTLFNPKPHP